VWRLRSKLRLRDLAEMFGEHGFPFTHEAVRAWEARCAPLIAAQLRSKRTGQAGRSWHVDETTIKVAGVWNYLYRATDREGVLVMVWAVVVVVVYPRDRLARHPKVPH
jgi:transposase-like protein